MTPQFPAILVTRDTFQVVDSAQFPSAGETTSTFLAAAQLFDSAGFLWEIGSVRASDAVTPHARMFGQALKLVELVTTQPTACSLATLAARLCAVVDTDSDDLYSQWVSHDALKSLFRTATSATELIHRARSLGE